MAKHALGRPASPTVAVLPAPATASVPTRYRRRSVSAFLVGATALGGAAFLPGLADAATGDPLPSECTQTGNQVTCTYTGAGAHQFVAPTGVSSFQVTASGASGGAGGNTTGHTGGAGGFGKVSSGTVTVATGSDRIFDIFNGSAGTAASATVAGQGGQGNGAGGNGANGGPADSSTTPATPAGAASGGGGGGTSITRGNSQDVLVVAGGGAGGGGAGSNTNGSAGDPTASPVTPTGPNGGTGAAGTFAGAGAGGGGGGGFVGGAAGIAGLAAGNGGDGGSAGSNGGSAASGTAGTATAAGDGRVVITYGAPAGPAQRNKADLATTIDAPASLEVGEDGEIDVTVTNNGAVAAQNVSTRVSIPAGLRIVGGDSTRPTQATLAPGQSVTYTYDVVGTRQRPRVAVTAVSTSRGGDANSRDNHDKEYVAVTAN